MKNHTVQRYVQDQTMQDLSCSRKPVPASAIFRRCAVLPRLPVCVGMIHRP